MVPVVENLPIHRTWPWNSATPERVTRIDARILQPKHSQLLHPWHFSCLESGDVRALVFPGMERLTKFVQNRAWKRVGSNSWGQYKGREDTFRNDAFCRNNTDLAATISIGSFQDLPRVKHSSKWRFWNIQYQRTKKMNPTFCQNSVKIQTVKNDWKHPKQAAPQHRSTVQPRLESEVDVKRTAHMSTAPCAQQFSVDGLLVRWWYMVLHQHW